MAAWACGAQRQITQHARAAEKIPMYASWGLSLTSYIRSQGFNTYSYALLRPQTPLTNDHEAFFQSGAQHCDSSRDHPSSLTAGGSAAREKP